MNSPIDIVLPWLDDRDEAWQKEKEESLRKYWPEPQSASHIRFEGWDNLHLWFRAIEKFMPWVHRIILITWGHLPKFLDAGHPKLAVVRHKDYIPAEYLPTYNSNTIEMNCHRIASLSENFILFNDDTIPLQPIPESYYFQDNVVCDEAVEGIIPAAEEGPIAHMARYVQVNNLMIINRHFRKREVQEKHHDKWFCHTYGDLLERTVSLAYWYTFPGFHDPHMPNAMKKSTLQKLWQVEPDALDTASRNHFRAHTDVTQYLVRYWQLCEGDFVPRRTLGKMCLVNRENCTMYADGIARQAWPMVSLNEDCAAEEFPVIRAEINAALEKLLPEKSTFET